MSDMYSACISCSVSYRFNTDFFILGKFSGRHADEIFLDSPETGFKFSNCLLRNVKTCYLGKIKRKIKMSSPENFIQQTVSVKP